MKRRDFIKMMEEDGWTFKRDGSNHTIYTLESHSFPVPRHNEIKPGIEAQYKKKMKEIRG